MNPSGKARPARPARPARIVLFAAVSFAAVSFAAVSFAAVPVPAQETKIRVAAAANLTGVLPKIVDAFVRARPRTGVETSFGSSGALAAQIRSGAPFDAFLSADVEQAARLASEGYADIASGGAVVYATGVLCVASRHGVDPSGGLGFLLGPAYRSIAIAEPKLAPYGAAAMDALEKAGLAPWLSGRFAYGSNLSQAVQFVRTGAADAGFINLSAVLGDPAFSGISWAKVDPSLYAPIEQAGLVLKSDGRGANPEARLETARSFMAFLRGPEGQAVLGAAGYALNPGGT